MINQKTESWKVQKVFNQRTEIRYGYNFLIVGALKSIYLWNLNFFKTN